MAVMELQEINAAFIPLPPPQPEIFGIGAVFVILQFKQTYRIVPFFLLVGSKVIVPPSHE